MSMVTSGQGQDQPSLFNLDKGFNLNEGSCPSPTSPPTPSSAMSTPSLSRQPSQQQFNTASPVSSQVFLVTFFDQILTSKSITRFPTIKESGRRALELSKTDGFCKERAQLAHNIDVLLQPLIECCQSGSGTLSLIALDGLSKLITYDYLPNESNFSGVKVNVEGAQKERTPVDKAVMAICDCFKGEHTDEKVQTQVIKGLIAAVSSTTTVIHQEALLNAIRTLYNIFLLSRDPSNQIVAQGTLIQMTRSVFSRISTEESTPELKKSPSITSMSSNYTTSIFSKDYESTSEIKEESTPDEKLSLEAIGGKAAEAAANAQIQGNICDTASDLNVLDGFLLFRALCKLSIKPFRNDSTIETRSMSLRSKLLSLYLILIVISEFPDVFIKSKVFFLSGGENELTRKVREEIFLVAVKPYFGLCLSRNLVSTTPKIYELALAIFESTMESMRSQLKNEIEVYLKEIIIPILEMKSSGNQHQKHILFTMFLSKLTTDPQTLVEIFLNYDCDRGSLNNNIFEHMTSSISKIATSVSAQEILDTPALVWEEQDSFQASSKGLNRTDLLNLPALTAEKFTSSYISNSFFSKASFNPANLQLRALYCLVNVLKSLAKWSDKGKNIAESEKTSSTYEKSSDDVASDIGQIETDLDLPLSDDPNHFERSKIQKQALQIAVTIFNQKPKRGIESLLNSGLIASDSPQDIAHFLLETPDLDKVMIGEYLGEADQLNVSIMHSFVDLLDFNGLEFVPALRRFLQTFRLPGEAQKIDRFMLKFAERYVGQNEDIFVNADTAYVLGYSVILLNTDLHNPQVKKRMTKPEFFKNNRGINDGKDLPEEFLSEIYDQIFTKEIKLKEEPEPSDETAPSLSRSLTASSIAAQFDILGGRNKKSQEAQASSMQLQNNAEKYLKKMLSRKANRDGLSGPSIFYSASHFEHVRPMFEVCWMTCLAALSGLLKSSESPKVNSFCLDGFRHAIHIASFFDMDLARNALVNALANFCFLTNIMEMKAKNLEAIRAVLDISVEDGNYLKSSWGDTLQIVNHLVRLQLIPNFSATTNGRDRSLVAHRDSQARKFKIALIESNSQSMLIAVDKVFAYTVHLNGAAIVDFMKALSSIAWEELEELPTAFDKIRAQSSPQMFSIQKVVEVAYYNMNRIRLEWKEIWEVLAPLFCKVGCHQNEAVSAYAVDSLRQLTMKFLDKEELPHFKFQKEFLKPFVYIIENSKLISTKDMVLQCVKQMFQSNASYIKSGWRTVLEILGKAAGSKSEAIVIQAYEMAKTLSTKHFELVIAQPENFGSYFICLSQFCKNPYMSRTGLHALETCKRTSDMMIQYAQDHPDRVQACVFAKDEIYAKTQLSFPELNFWIPIFHNLMDIISEVHDLEIRTFAIDTLFGYLNQYGSQFPDTFWHYLLSDVVFPIFAGLGNSKAQTGILEFANEEDQMIWISSTLVQALRKFVQLFTDYFDKVFQFLDGLLDLLTVCLCQENPTLCQIGSDCFKTLVENNVDKLTSSDWDRLLSIIIRLFHASSRVSAESEIKTGLTVREGSTSKDILSKIEKSFESKPLPVLPRTPGQQLTLCLTTIQIVETVFLQNPAVFAKIESSYIFSILDLIERAYLETKEINSEFDIQSALERQAVTKLERFAASSLSLELNCMVCLIKVLLKMYTSTDQVYAPHRSDIEARIVPLCFDAFTQFNSLSQYPLCPGVQNIYDLWHNVVLRIGNFLCIATGSEFKAVFSPNSQVIIQTLRHRHLSLEVRDMIYNIMNRVNELYIHPSADNQSLNEKVLEKRHQSIQSVVSVDNFVDAIDEPIAVEDKLEEEIVSDEEETTISVPEPLPMLTADDF